MTRPLSSKPDLEQLKRQAKELLKAQQAHDPSVCPILRHLSQFADVPETTMLHTRLSLVEIQYALAMEYGFSSWNALKQHVRAKPESVTKLPQPIPIALVSFQTGSKEDNLRMMENVLRENVGVELFVFPEVSASGWPAKVDGQRDFARHAETVPDGATVMRVVELARRYHTVICTGLFETCEGHLFHASILCGPEGYIGKQQKLYPGGVMHHGVFTGGQQLEVFHLFGHPCVILASEWVLPEPVYLAGLQDAAFILAPSDSYTVDNATILTNLATARVLDSNAHLLAAFGGDITGETEFMAGLVASPYSMPNVVLQVTRSSDAVKVIPFELTLTEPRTRKWGTHRDRAPRLLANLQNDDNTHATAMQTV